MLDQSAQGTLVIIVSAYAIREIFHLMQRGESVVHCADQKTQAPHEFLRRKLRHMTAKSLGKSCSDRMNFIGQHGLHEWQRLNHASTEYPDEMMAPAITIHAQFKYRPEVHIPKPVQRDWSAVRRSFGVLQLR